MAVFDARGKPNRALLVGVSEYDLTRPPHGVPGDLPAVRHNLNLLQEALRRGRVFDEREITVSRSPDQVAFGRELRTAAEEAQGVLLLYFAGHGAIPSAGDELFLQLRNASVVAGGHAVFPGGEPFTTVLTVLAASRAERIVVVLDCCFAGNAAWLWELFRDKRHVLLLMSVQANHRIDAGDAHTPTPFTAELGRLLEGRGDGAPRVTFRDLADGLRERMTADGLRTLRDAPWEPQSRAEPGEDVLLAVRAGGAGGAGEGVGGTGGAGTTGGGASGGPDPVGGGRPTVPSPADFVEPTLPGATPSGPTSPGLTPPGPTLPGPTPADPDPPPRRSLRAAALRRFLAAPAGALAVCSRRARAVVGPRRRAAGRSARRPPSPAGLLLIGAAVLIALAIGAYGVFIALVDGDSACAPPLELRVLTDPDLEPTVRAAADAYLTSEENTRDDCRRSGVTVYSAGTADAVTALRRQTGAWQEPPDDDTNPQRDVGPQPDVWIPGSRADVARVAAGQDTDAVAVLEPADGPLAYSPVVLAVPQNLAAEALDDRVGPSLDRMLDTLRARHADAEVRRPDPEFTVTGLLATVGLYASGADAEEAGSGSGAGTVDHAGAERRLDQSGPPSPTAADLLCTLPDDDAVDNRTAALVPEFLMKSGVGCDSARRAPRLAQYPGDVPGLEPVFVRVRWAGADRDAAERDRAAEDFREWLAGAGGRAAFARDGFRAATDSRALLDTENVADGVLQAPSPLTEPAGRDAMEAALTGYRGAHGPGRVLFLLDSSGSMGDLWEGPSGGPGLLRQSLGGLGEEDEYGVWSVYGTGERTHAPLLEFGRHSRADAERIIADHARVRDAEADPRDALLAALDDMEGRGADDTRPDLIVFVTDDEDAGRLDGAGLDTVLDRARAARVPVTMVSLTGGGCDAGRPDARISAASGGRCLDADDDLGAALHDEVARTGTGED
ncbi:vWA domain-containing protein [Streptomyces poriticola]|uniref:vWA domain-containing protein n=1 Tax=Streptomyces poriticola TaxID=3120506 RepID=UPI002FCE2B83